MNIIKHHIDDLNAVVNITIEKDDFQPQVEKILVDYKKKANIPGFRKGHVPMSLVKKQFEKSVKVEEINKLLQESLNRYIVEEKLDILGNPLPKLNADFSWEDENFTFDFELGLAPKFQIDWAKPSTVSLVKIEVDDDFLKDEITHLRKQYGKVVSESEVTENGRVLGTLTFDYKGEHKEKNTTIELTQVQDKAQKQFIGKKIGDVVALKTKGLFKDDHDLMHTLSLDHSDAHGFDAEIQFTITEISRYELAELNQEFFDKLFGEGRVSTEDEMKAEIKKTVDAQLNSQSEQKFLNDATEYLIENTKFDLPADFLTRWLQTTSDKEMNTEQATEEYKRSEKGLRYQLIENQIAQENNIQISREELKNFSKSLLRVQFAQYGSETLDDSFLDGVADRIIQNQEEAKRISEQVMSQKLLNVYKEKLHYTTKTTTYKEFVEESYK